MSRSYSKVMNLSTCTQLYTNLSNQYFLILLRPLLYFSQLFGIIQYMYMYHLISFYVILTHSDIKLSSSYSYLMFVHLYHNIQVKHSQCCFNYPLLNQIFLGECSRFYTVYTFSTLILSKLF